MSLSPEQLKVKKDAAISALFSLNKASNDASYALLDLINYLESNGFDASEMRSALNGGTSQVNGNFANVKVATPSTPKAQAPSSQPQESKGSSESKASVETTVGSEPESKKDSSAIKEKKKRAPRDPNAPKRPLNAYLEFCNEDGKKIAEERKTQGLPNLARPEMSAIVKEHWDALSEDELQSRLKKHQKEMEIYHDKLATYKSSIAEKEPGSENLSSSQAGPLSQLSQPSQIVSDKLATSSKEGTDAPATSPAPVKKKQKKSKEEGREKEKKKKSKAE